MAMRHLFSLAYCHRPHPTMESMQPLLSSSCIRATSSWVTIYASLKPSTTSDSMPRPFRFSQAHHAISHLHASPLFFWVRPSLGKTPIGIQPWLSHYHPQTGLGDPASPTTAMPRCFINVSRMETCSWKLFESSGCIHFKFEYYQTVAQFGM